MSAATRRFFLVRRLSAQVVEPLAVVGVAPETLMEMLGQIGPSDHPYLAGSLSAGLGNSGSDLDIYVVVESAATGLPVMFFIDRRILDIEYVENREISMTVQACDGGTVRLDAGRIALGQAPTLGTCYSISRWLCAVPLMEDSPPMVAPASRASFEATLARKSFEDALVSASLAIDADQESIQMACWRRATVSTLSLLVHFAGETYGGTKWIWKRAARAGIGQHLVADASGAGSMQRWQRVWDAVGLPRVDPRDLVTIEPFEFSETYEFGDRRFVRFGDELVPIELLQEESRSRAQTEQLLVAGALVATPRRDTVDGWLREVSVP